MSKIKILIVEDEVLISDYLAGHLRNSGCEITDIVDSGEQALQSVEMNPPDIVIMDIELQGKLDGIQTTAEINKTCSLPVIYLTKLSDKSTFKKAKLTNPISYLLKPFNQFDIINAIELALYNASCFGKKENIKKNTSQDFLYELSNRIFIKEATQLLKVDISDIIYIQGSGVYSSIKTIHKDFTISHTLKKIYNQIQHPALLRTHRSFIVNLNKIDSITRKKSIVLNIDEIIDKTELGKREILAEIPIGEKFKDDLFKNLKCI